MIGDNLRRVFTWFAEHPRQRHPRRVALASRVGGVRDRWLVLVAPAQWPRLATVDALVDSDGHIRVEQTNVAAFAISAQDLPASATRPMRVVVDGSELSTTVDKGWVIVRRGDATHTWRWEHADAAPAAPLAPPLHAAVAERLEQGQAEDRLATAVAELLKEHFGVQGCVLDADKIRVARGELSAEKLLDAWVFPEGRLVRARIEPAKLQSAAEVISRGRAIVVPETLVHSRRKKVEIVAPLALVLTLGVAEKDMEPATSLTIGELLAALATQTAVPAKSAADASRQDAAAMPFTRSR
jgi:hypothetical protein